MESANSSIDDDLYKYIRPPIPLLDKSKYTDDGVQTYQQFM